MISSAGTSRVTADPHVNTVNYASVNTHYFDPCFAVIRPKIGSVNLSIIIVKTAWLLLFAHYVCMVSAGDSQYGYITLIHYFLPTHTYKYCQ